MKRQVISVLLFSFVFTGIGYGQGNKPVKSISLDQLLGKKKTENVVQSTAKQQSKISQQGYREHIGAIGSVLERIELKGNTLTQDKISTPYRRYVVNGTMDLGGKTISMPDGCILDLENGSLKNGSLKMNTTLVTPIYGISKERNISKVKVSGEYYETLVDLWGEQTEPLFPWDTTAPQKVYIVDLKKFGITPGYQKRGSDNHYTDKQYDLMYNNGIGFTNAIRWAYDNGYDGIRFPKKDYCFTPRTTKNEKPATGPIVLVQDLDKFDIDFGGGSYYLILDSKKKSQHFAVTPEKPYAQGGTMFFVACCINLQLHNGRFVGDRKLRDYDEAPEKSLENSRAFSLSAHCHNVRVHHLELCEFMADGISIGQTGNFYDDYNGVIRGPGFVELGTSRLKHFYRNKVGLILLSQDNCEKYTNAPVIDITSLYKGALKHPIISTIKELRKYTINNNRGYTRIPNVFSNVEVLTLSEQSSKPIRLIPVSYLESFTLNDNESKVILQCKYDDMTTEDGVKHNAAVTELISDNVVIENCYIHDNHRGGISGGSNNNIIRNCSFSKSTTDTNYQGKQIPLFLIGGTNYHINYEDSFAKNLIITNCSFKRDIAQIGKLLFGVFTLGFHNNYSDAGVRVYNCICANISDNVFNEQGLWLSPWVITTENIAPKRTGYKYLTRNILYHDNRSSSLAEPKAENRTVLISYSNSRL